MSLTLQLMLFWVLALAIVLLAAVAIYWHAETKDWMRIALQAFDDMKDLVRELEGKR